jgi:hypothetical protein
MIANLHSKKKKRVKTILNDNKSALREKKGKKQY